MSFIISHKVPNQGTLIADTPFATGSSHLTLSLTVDMPAGDQALIWDFAQTTNVHFDDGCETVLGQPTKLGPSHPCIECRILLVTKSYRSGNEAYSAWLSSALSNSP